VCDARDDAIKITAGIKITQPFDLFMQHEFEFIDTYHNSCITLITTHLFYCKIFRKENKPTQKLSIVPVMNIGGFVCFVWLVLLLYVRFF